MALIINYDELELLLPLNHLEMLYHVHSPVLRQHPHVQKTYWEGILTRRKVETLDLPCSQRDHKSTAAETQREGWTLVLKGGRGDECYFPQIIFF